MRSTFDATGEVLLVTGGARGIGAAVSRAFAAAGGTAVVVDILEPEEPWPGLQHVVADVSDRAALVKTVAEVRDRFGRIDGLVAGAAVQPRVDVVDTSEAVWRRAIEVNLNGVVWSCQAVLPAMLEAGRGSIVLFASGLAVVGRAQAAAYASTKGAMIPFAKSLAAEVAERHVRVNVVFPGVIDTPQFQAANPSGAERDHWAKTTGIGVPEDVVGPLLFLLSDAATMSGSVLTRDRVFSREER